MELVGPPSRNAFDGVVCGDGDVRGKFLCARDEKKLMVGAAKNASGVGIDLYMDDLRVIASANVDEGIELDADRAL